MVNSRSGVNRNLYTSVSKIPSVTAMMSVLGGPFAIECIWVERTAVTFSWMEDRLVDAFSLIILVCSVFVTGGEVKRNAETRELVSGKFAWGRYRRLRHLQC
jgi:hypothetical protein